MNELRHKDGRAPKEEGKREKTGSVSVEEWIVCGQRGLDTMPQAMSY